MEIPQIILVYNVILIVLLAHIMQLTVLLVVWLKVSNTIITTIHAKLPVPMDFGQMLLYLNVLLATLLVILVLKDLTSIVYLAILLHSYKIFLNKVILVWANAIPAFLEILLKYAINATWLLATLAMELQQIVHIVPLDYIYKTALVTKHALLDTTNTILIILACPAITPAPLVGDP